MASANGEVRSTLERVWSTREGNEDYFSSSPEILPTRAREKGDVMESVMKLGVPLFGMTNRGGVVSPSRSFVPREEPNVEAIDSEDDEVYDAKRIQQEFFSSKVLGSGRDIIKREWRENAQRRKEREEAQKEDESEVESEDDIKQRGLPRTDSPRYSVLPAVAKAKPRKQKKRKRRKWFSRRKRSTKSTMAGSEEESEQVPVVRTDTQVFNVKKQVEAEDEAEENMMLSALKVAPVIEEEVGLDTEAEDSEKVDSEEEAESEAELFKLNKRESGADRLAAFLDAEKKKIEALQSESEGEEDEEDEYRENALQLFLRSNQREAVVEEVVESEEKGPTRFQQFIAMTPPHEDEIIEQEREEAALVHQVEPVAAKRESKSKRVSRERKELEEEKLVTSVIKPRVAKAKRVSSSKKVKAKRKSKRRSGKRITKPVPEGYYDTSFVKPTNVETTESSVMVVQAWFSAFVALLITLFTFMKAKALGVAPVNTSNGGHASNSRVHGRTRSSASRRRSLKPN